RGNKIYKISLTSCCAKVNSIFYSFKKELLNFVTVQPSARFRCALSRCGRAPYEFSSAYAYESKLSPAYADENSHG
ncbi:hypothetical protein, partial [Muricomes intestini]|uniref:hypothetical protein n=1 Tax=Muricomes intestini TaxID=1796634 RepID=UPI002FE265FE